MASSDTFDDLKNELSDQCKNHTTNLSPIYTTVTQPALDKLLEKWPNKFDKKNDDYAQKSVYKKKSKVDKTKHRNQIRKHLHWERSHNGKTPAVQKYPVDHWNLKIDWVS